MKKILTVSILSLSVLSFSFAEEANKPVMGKARQMIMEMPAAFTTGDPVVDAQVKVLQKEMQDKMRVIAEEYSVKIRKVIGDKKPMVATATKEMLKDKMHDYRKDMKKEMKDMAYPAGDAGGMEEGERKPMNKMREFFRGMFKKEEVQTQN